MTELPTAPQPLPRPTIDAHTHLVSTVRRTKLEIPEILEMARKVGVERVVDVGWDVSSSQEVIANAQQYPQVVACVAIHPSDAATAGDNLGAELVKLEALLDSEGIRGVGETGLDYYWVKDSAGQRLEKESFAAHIAWANQRHLPLVIHDRDAHHDVLDVLDAEGVPEKVMMHCFSGDADFARACLDRGCYLSFPGTITFKPNTALREALAIAPTDRILVETDAPYLTPMPHRGKPNGPYLIPLTLQFMAAHLDMPVSDLADATRENAETFFGSWELE